MARAPGLPTALVATSVAVALLLQLYPLRGELALWRPPFPLLIALFWLLSEPTRFGVGLTWSIGLLMDLLFDGILGQSALACGLCAYLVQSLDQRLQHFSSLHLCGLAALLVTVYQVVVVSLDLLLRHATLDPALFYSALSAALLWPLIAGGLGRLHQAHW
ncbi:MAG: rod shape-determining protein MreD [Porticoccaceae bacterium]